MILSSLIPEDTIANVCEFFLLWFISYCCNCSCNSSHLLRPPSSARLMITSKRCSSAGELPRHAAFCCGGHCQNLPVRLPRVSICHEGRYLRHFCYHSNWPPFSSFESDWLESTFSHCWQLWFSTSRRWRSLVAISSTASRRKRSCASGLNLVLEWHWKSRLKLALDECTSQLLSRRWTLTARELFLFISYHCWAVYGTHMCALRATIKTCDKCSCNA
jgi:hypothetical protein